MTNATLALNVSRPAAPATPPPAGRDQDDTSSSKRFDAALDAAHAHARDPHDPQPEDRTHPSSPGDDPAPAAKASDTRTSDRKPDDDATKKDDTSDDDTSIAATMLSLIGVPPKVTEVAAKALDAAKGGGEPGATPGAPTALLGLLPGVAGLPAGMAGMAGVLPGTAAGAHAAIEDLAGLKDAASSMVGTAMPAAAAAIAAPSFGSLLDGPGVGLLAAKDDASVDRSNPNPMPFAHAQGAGPVDAPVLQVQATQVATSPQFAQELGEQIAWMGSGDVKEARIKLHPEELGSMDVRVNLDGGKVNVAIIAQHPAAVHAVQQTLSQLDSMLAHHGLSLGQADVGQRQAERGGDGSGQGTSGQGADGGTSGSADTVATTRVSRGLVDEVA